MNTRSQGHRTLFLGQLTHSCINYSSVKGKVELFRLKCIWHEKLLLLIWKAFQYKDQCHSLFWNIFFRFGNIDVFVLCKSATWWRHVVEQLKMRKCVFNNISGNICGVIFKLGTINLIQKGSKMTPVMLLPWQQFCYWSYSSINWNSHFFHNKNQLHPKIYWGTFLTIWEVRLFQSGPSLSLLEVASWDICFLDGKGLKPSRLPWQPNYRIHFVRCLIWISSAKFKEYHTNISSISAFLISSQDDVIMLLIFIIQRYCNKENAIELYIAKPLK